MSGLHVVRAGLLTTVQDLGRPGHARLGVAMSGALDPAALRLANRLVGNAEDAAGLELTLGDVTLRPDRPVLLALTGAPAELVVEHAGSRRVHGPGTGVPVPAGATVRVGRPAQGVRSWLAVRGGLVADQVLGSAATDLLAGIGAPLADGDDVRVGDAVVADPPAVDVAPVPAQPRGDVVLRLVPGPRDDWFDEQALAALTGPWTVGQQSNRVGLRLEGPGLRRRPSHAARELASEAVVAGAVQVAANGAPVLFLADHPVTGGYPVVGCVPRDDLPLAAQVGPGDRLRFRLVAGPRLP